MLEEIIKKCRSYRRFDGKFKVSKGVLEELIEMARYAPCARNQQALKFILSCDSRKNNLIFPCLKWAATLKGWKGPAEGERPTAYIIILGDKEISQDFGCDHGIAAYNILLEATEKDLGGCMIGSVDREILRRNLGISDRYEILLVVAIGKPAGKVIVEDMQRGGSIRYYHDKDDVHHVPKRILEELIVE